MGPRKLYGLEHTLLLDFYQGGDHGGGVGGCLAVSQGTSCLGCACVLLCMYKRGDGGGMVKLSIRQAL